MARAKAAKRKALVIGAGLSGLAAAHGLITDGWEVKVLEKEAEPGGRCRTVRQGEYLFDTGAQHFRDSFDRSLTTAIESGIADTLRIPASVKAFVSGCRTVPFTPRSSNPLTLLPWQAMGPAALADLAGVALPLFRNYHGFNMRFPGWWTDGDSRTALDLLKSRTTASYRRNIAAPVARYVLGAGLSEISAAAFLVALRYTFLDRTGCFTGGMGLLSKSLASGLDIETGIEVTEVVVESGRAQGVKARPAAGGRSKAFGAEMVVCALPAPLLKGVVRLEGPAAGAVSASTFVPLLVVNLALTRSLDSSPGTILLDEGFTASWICSSAGKTAELAPLGHCTLTVIFSGDAAAKNFKTGDAETTDLAWREAYKVLPLTGAGPVASRVDRHPLGLPLVSPGYAERVARLADEGTGMEGLELAGDWTSSPTVEGAVSSGFAAAERASRSC